MENTRQTSGRPPALPVRGHGLHRRWAFWTIPAPQMLGPWLRYLAHGASTVLMVVAPVVLLAMIAAIIGYVRLLHGPVSLKFLASHIERGITAELGEFGAHIDGAMVTLAESGGLEFRLTNITISEPDGDLVASAPLAAVELSRSALWTLRAVPERVYLIEPKISLSYEPESGLTLRFSEQAESGARGDAAETKGADPPPEAETPNVPAAAPVAGPGPGLPASLQRIDLARTLAESTARARRGRNATSKLREIGLRNATVVFDHGGKTSEWQIVEAAIDLEHMKRRSVISGAAKIASQRGPWLLSFRTEDFEKRNLVKVSTSVRDLVPSAFAEAVPQLSLLGMLDLPVAADASLVLSTSGEIKEAALMLEFGRGELHLPALTAPLTVDAAMFHLGYDVATHHLKIAPSTLKWGDSHMEIEGAMTSEPGPEGRAEWHFGLQAKEGVLAAEEFGVGGVPIDSWVAAGRLVPDAGLVELSEFTLKAGGAVIAINGELSTGGEAPSTRVEATMSPMTLPTLKALWPRAIAPGARQWVGKHVTRGSLKSGTFKLLSGKFLGAEANGGQGPAERLTMAIEAGELEMVPLPRGLPIEAPSALIRLENNALEITVPDAALIASPARKLDLKGGRFTVVGVDTPIPVGELAFRTQTSLAALLEAARRSRIGLASAGDFPLEGLDGKAEGQFKFTMPLKPDASALDLKAEGKARISDLRCKQCLGSFDVQGGAIDIAVSETGVNAGGEMLINGVLAKLELQRIFEAPPDMQPPLRITMTLDNSDRTQIGLDINNLVQGEVPVEVTVRQDFGAEPAVHVRADLTNAELIMDDIAWRKAPGRAAQLQCDVAKGRTYPTELQNFKITGDSIAIEGWMAVDADHEVREYFFPDFSLNVVSRLEVQGKLGTDRIWSIKARGSTFDGKDLFRSLVALGQADERQVKPLRPAHGIEFDAVIDNVLGHSEATLRGMKLKLSRRADKLTALDAQATLDGGKQIVVQMKKEPSEKRLLYAETADAGQAFKVIGFYPNMQGGRGRLEVNLDGQGPAEKTGTLWVDDFRVLGDPVISEVVSSAEGSSSSGQRRVVREVFEFDRMKVPFSVGHGQFVLEESYLKGPVVGATLRGKVDYSAKRVNIGGTYVPLQGLNSVFCDIPVFGPIVTGLKCEGVFGITYAIQGPMEHPEVIVNPLSMLTPGILRGIMEMTSPNPKVLPRSDRPKSPAEERVRASSSAASDGEGGAKKPGPTPIDGWSSETSGAEGAKKQ